MTGAEGWSELSAVHNTSRLDSSSTSLRFPLHNLTTKHLLWNCKWQGGCGDERDETGKVLVNLAMLQWKSYKYYILWGCVCSLYYPAMSVAFIIQLYCHLWPVCLYHIFPHYLINDTNLEGGNYWTQNVYFDFFIYFSEKLKKWSRYYGTCTWVFFQNSCYSCQIVMKLEFPR